MPELWDLYDKNLIPLNKTHVRGEPLEKGEYHFVAAILSINNDGKILVTKRHPDKPFGGKWEITGGSVLAGETPLVGARRELFEETGLNAETSQLIYMGQILREKSGCVHNFYLYKGDFSEKDIVLQESETVDFKIIPPDEIYKMAKSGEFLDFVYNRIKAVYADIFGRALD
ncbi:MAG: NUDIX domain-containing protein [Hominimerdicola sp.]